MSGSCCQRVACPAAGCDPGPSRRRATLLRQGGRALLGGGNELYGHGDTCGTALGSVGAHWPDERVHQEGSRVHTADGGRLAINTLAMLSGCIVFVPGKGRGERRNRCQNRCPSAVPSQRGRG